MQMNCWAEVCPRAQKISITLPSSYRQCSADISNGYLRLESSSEECFSFRVGSLTTLKDIKATSRRSITSISLQCTDLEPFGFTEHWPSRPLRAPITCRHCNHILVTSGKRGYLIPEMSTDMHACEECRQPTDKLHDHGKKQHRVNHSDRLYISDLSLLVESTLGTSTAQTNTSSTPDQPNNQTTIDNSIVCPECTKPIGRLASSHNHLLNDLRVSGRWVELDKKSLMCHELPCLAEHTEFSETGRIIERAIEERGIAATRRLVLKSENDFLEIKILSDILFVHLLEPKSIFETSEILDIEYQLKAPKIGEPENPNQTDNYQKKFRALKILIRTEEDKIDQNNSEKIPSASKNLLWVTDEDIASIRRLPNLPEEISNIFKGWRLAFLELPPQIDED